jgi:dipeptidyl aminopeptidase/acylaminoacyl peptidase
MFPLSIPRSAIGRPRAANAVALSRSASVRGRIAQAMLAWRKWPAIIRPRLVGPRRRARAGAACYWEECLVRRSAATSPIQTHMLRSLGAVLLLSLCAVGAVASGAPQARRLLTADDFYRIQIVSDPQCSPDGQWVAYVVTTNDREVDESRSALWMVSWDGTQHIQLTNAANDIRAPRFSPDGRYLAFLSKPAGSQKSQIMVFDRRGGEARALTSINGEIREYAWSPNGKRLALVIQDGGERTAEAPMVATATANAVKPIVIRALHFKQDVDGYLGSEYEQHLYLFDVEAQKIDALTTDSGFNEDAPVWSPDSEQIAFARSREMGPDPDGMTDLDVIDARPGAKPRQLVRSFAPNKQRLAWSPDGKLIAYLQGLKPIYSAYTQDRLAVVSAAGGAPRPLTDKLDRAVTSYAFSSDGAAITVLVENDGAIYPARVDLGNGAIERMIDATVVVSGLTVVGGNTAVLSATSTTASEVYALEAGRLRRLTAHNDALLAEVQLGEIDDFRFKGSDGTEIRGVMVKPASFASGRRYPTILWIHGGPNSQDDHSLAFDGHQFERQLLAANGYVVLGINYRGSSGRGRAFAQEIFADWGHKEVEDLLAGIDHVVAEGIADPERLGIGGWSYGGALTDYTIATDGRFRAAVSGAGEVNQIAMYGSDEYAVQYNNELGVPWKNTALWMKVSFPFFHADRIHTPTLFMGGDKDFNVPIAGSEQMYQALRTLGVQTELVVYPGQFHSFARPSYLKDRAERAAAWFGRFLQPAG